MIVGATYLTFALAISIAQDPAFLPPRILRSEGSPVTLNTARLAVEGDHPVASLCTLTTKAGDRAFRVVVQFVVYDAQGRRKDGQRVDLSAGDIPEGQGSEWSLTVPLSNIHLNSEDQLVLGLSEVDSELSGHWSAEDLVNAADREFSRRLKSESVVVVPREDAPASITQATLLEAPPAAPAGIRLILSNARPAPVSAVTLNWHLFDGTGGLRASGSHTSRVALLPQSQTVIDVGIRGVTAARTSTDRWIGVVCLSRTQDATGEWKHRCTTDEAREAIWQRPGKQNAP